MVQFLFFLAVLRKKKSFETYGSFCIEFLNDKKGKLLENDELFLNIFDFYTLYHAPGNMTLRSWYYPKLTKLERILRKKWKQNEKKVKTLPLINIIIKKIKEEDAAFDPTLYLNDKEQFFANIESWKLTFEKDYLIEHPYLLREPIRHKKIYKFKRVLLPR